jgi:hypothetical protein
VVTVWGNWTVPNILFAGKIEEPYVDLGIISLSMAKSAAHDQLTLTVQQLQPEGRSVSVEGTGPCQHTNRSWSLSKTLEGAAEARFGLGQARARLATPNTTRNDPSEYSLIFAVCTSFAAKPGR